MKSISVKNICITNDENFRYQIYEMVALLRAYLVPKEKISPQAFMSYVLYDGLHNFEYIGIRLDDNHNLNVLEEGLMVINAPKHLAYLREETTKTHKKISKEENLEELHNQWIETLCNQGIIKIGSFQEKYTYLSELIGTDIMPVDNDILVSYQFLLDWSESFEVFDLVRLFSMEVWNTMEAYDARMMFPDSGFDEKKHGVFVSFAVDGAGGHYLLWYYPNMEKEPSVVFISSYGEMLFLAPSLNEYICTLPKCLNYDLSELREKLKDYEEWEELDLYDISSDYEEKYGLEISEKELVLLLQKDIEKYVKKAHELLSYRNYNDEDQKKFEKLMKDLLN